MTRRTESNVLDLIVELLTEQGFDGMAEALQLILNQAMLIERSQVLGAEPYERTSERTGHANGFKPKTVLSRLGKLELKIPQTRGVEFYPSALERGERSERALKLAVAEMYVQGVSTRKVAAVLEELCGTDVSSTQVSRAAKLLDEELEKWRTRPLGRTPYLVLDARYEKVRHQGEVVSCAVLTAIGVLPDGRRSILGTSVALSEAEIHWRDFLASLQARGLTGVEYVVSDDHPGIKAALRARLTGVPWQRCQFHLAQNALHYAPTLETRRTLAAALRRVFGAADRREAEERLARLVAEQQRTAPKLAAWLEANVPEGFAVFALPESHRRRMRTTNGLERLNKEIKRRTRVATLFPNEASLLRLVTAVLMEVSEEWETGKIYLTFTELNSTPEKEHA
jgi:transposase-like protein